MTVIVVVTNPLVREETPDHAQGPDHHHVVPVLVGIMILTAITVVIIRVSDLDDLGLDLGLLIDPVILNLQDLNQTVIKSKKEKKSHSSKAYGTYGILTPADMWNKENEFQAWLMEVKKLSPETIPHNKMKDHFIGFMEDYNTVTMPHEKFYNLTQWEDRQRAIRMGEPLPESKQGAVNLLNDEEELRMKQRNRRKTNLSAGPQIMMTQSQLEEVRKVTRERVEADKLRKMGFDAGKKGVRYE
ncbi:hypothetical protein BGZ49_000230 [Haplosporangium sp. Z 27]|nr:hypothetical protein BGZ49_000230 [Haplosporangium sp. Z 27]